MSYRYMLVFSISFSNYFSFLLFEIKNFFEFTYLCTVFATYLIFPGKHFCVKEKILETFTCNLFNRVFSQIYFLKKKTKFSVDQCGLKIFFLIKKTTKNLEISPPSTSLNLSSKPMNCVIKPCSTEKSWYLSIFSLLI